MSHQNNLTVAQIPSDKVSQMIAKFSDASWRQYPAYAGKAAQQIGASSEYAAVFDGEDLLGLANVRVKRLPVLPGGIAFVSHGPMTVKKNGVFDANRYLLVAEALSQHYCESRGFALRLEQPLQIHGDLAIAGGALSVSGFREMSVRQYQTFLIDLSIGPDALRKALNGKWRTDLNRGEREDVQITRSSNPEDFDRFAPLLDELADKKGFSAPQDTDFFRDVAAGAGEKERIEIHLAYAGDDLIAGHIGAFSGNMAVYLLGAANNKGRDLRAAYLLQWAVINRAIELGMGYYDLGGADQIENPSVFRFKKRMGGELLVNAPIFQRWPSQPRKAVIALAEWAYGKLKGAR